MKTLTGRETDENKQQELRLGCSLAVHNQGRLRLSLNIITIHRYTDIDIGKMYRPEWHWPEYVLLRPSHNIHREAGLCKIADHSEHPTEARGTYRCTVPCPDLFEFLSLTETEMFFCPGDGSFRILLPKELKKRSHSTPRSNNKSTDTGLFK